MKEAKTLLKELKCLMGKTDNESEARRDEIALWIKEHRTPEIESAFNQFMAEGLGEVETCVDDLRKQLAGKFEMIPMSYIAKYYFGKSQSWLAQRINGCHPGPFQRDWLHPFGLNGCFLLHLARGESHSPGFFMRQTQIKKKRLVELHVIPCNSTSPNQAINKKNLFAPLTPTESPKNEDFRSAPGRSLSVHVEIDPTLPYAKM